jgi:hypothetical protein
LAMQGALCNAAQRSAARYSCIRGLIRGRSSHSPPLPFVDGCHSHQSPLPEFNVTQRCRGAEPQRFPLPHSPVATFHSPPTPFVHSWPYSWTVAPLATRHPPHSCIRGPIRGRLPQSPLATHPIRVFVAPFVDGCPSHHSPPTPFVYSWPHLWTVAPLASRHPPHSCIRCPIRGRLPHSPHSCIRGPIRGRLPQSPLAAHPIRAFVVPFVDGCPTRHSPSKPICRRSCFFVVFVVFVVGLMFAVWKSDWYQG